MKALIFDMDDTLVVEEASAEAAFLETCALAKVRYGIDPRDLHATLRETCRTFWRRSPARVYCVHIGISSWEALWARFLGEDENLRILRKWAPIYRQDSWYHALRRYGVDDPEFAGELALAFPKKRRKRHVVYDDVEPALEALGRAFRLGLLSNGVPDLQREKIEGSGIEKYVVEIVISGEVGVGKPDPRIFEIILNRLGIQPQEAVMVGNSLRSDIGGAQAVGMKAVWLNRDGKSRDESVVPDLEIRGLEELRETLQQGALLGGK